MILYNMWLAQQNFPQIIPSTMFNLKMLFQRLNDESFPLETRSMLELMEQKFTDISAWCNKVMETLTSNSEVFYVSAMFFIFSCLFSEILGFYSMMRFNSTVKMLKESVCKLFTVISLGSTAHTLFAMPTTYLHKLIKEHIVGELSPIAAFNFLVFAVSLLMPKLFSSVNSNMLIGSRVVTSFAFVAQFQDTNLLITASIQMILLCLGEKNREILASKLKNMFNSIISKFNGFAPKTAQTVLISFLPFLVIPVGVPDVSDAANNVVNDIVSVIAINKTPPVVVDEAVKAAENALAKSPYPKAVAQATAAATQFYTKLHPMGGPHTKVAHGTQVFGALVFKVCDAVHASKISNMKNFIRPQMFSAWQLPTAPVITTLVPTVRTPIYVIASELPTARETLSTCPTCKLKMDWNAVNTPTGVPNQYTRVMSFRHCGHVHQFSVQVINIPSNEELMKSRLTSLRSRAW